MPGLKLIVNSQQSQDATIPVRWCVDPIVLEDLNSQKVRPYLLMSVVVDGLGETHRYVVPLEQMMHYVQFHQPGRNRIVAAIVWMTYKSDKKNPSSILLKKHSHCEYSNAIFDHSTSTGDLVPEIRIERYDQYNKVHISTENADEVEVEVPKEFFASEPPKWEKRWVNLWFPYEPADQCEYRRRRFIAYTIQFPCVLVWATLVTLMRTSILALRILGGYWRNLGHLDFKRVLGMRRCEWNFDKNDAPLLTNSNGETRFMLLQILNPLKALGIFIPLALIFGIFEKRMLSLAELGFLLTVAAVVVFTLGLWEAGLNYFETKVLRKRSAQRKLNKKQAKQDKLYSDLVLLSCDRQGPAKLDALPPKRRTIKLYFLDLKREVCRPFAIKH